jgi:hypothetical protein
MGKMRPATPQSREPVRPIARPSVADCKFTAKSARFRSLIIQVGYETFGRMPRYLVRVESE